MNERTSLTKSELSTRVFFDAVNDYFFLLNREYPEKAALKLVGDRHRLSGNQRNCLYRGITSEVKAHQRKSKLIQDIKNQVIHIDGYNILFTIMNYLLGKTLFIANDGLLRDSGESYGQIENNKIFSRALELTLGYLSDNRPGHLTIYLDTTVKNFKTHSKLLEKSLIDHRISGKILSLRHADSGLKKIKDGIIVSSDSEIIDAVSLRLADVARQTLEMIFNIQVLDLEKLIRNL